MKTLLLDGKKFNLFMERMDKKMTINETNEKMLLVESWWDEIVTAAKGVSKSLTNSTLPTINTKFLPDLNKSIDEFGGVGENISKGIKNNLSNIKMIEGIIGAEAFTNLKFKWNEVLENIVKTFGLSDEVTSDIAKFIGGEGQELSETTLASLSHAQIEQLRSFRTKNLKLVKQIDDLEKVVSTAAMLGDNPTVVDLMGSMFGGGTIKSLDDFAKEFDNLDKILKNSPDSDVAQLWVSILRKSKLEGLSGSEAVKKLKQSLGNDASYITTSTTWRKQISTFIAKKLLGKVKDINFQLNKAGIDPNLTVIYKSHDGVLEIITCRSKSQLDSLVAHLEAGGMSPRIMDKKGILLSDLTLLKGGGGTAEEYSKGIIKANFYYTKMAIGGIVGVGMTYVGVCYMRAEKNYSSEEWDDILAGSTEKERENWGEKGLVTQIMTCVKEDARQITVAILDEGLEIYNKNVAPKMAGIEGAVNIFLDKECGRVNSSRDANGKPLNPCTDCLECTEANVKSWLKEIKIGGSDMSTIHSDIMEKVDPLTIFPELEASQAQAHMKSIIKKIKDDEKYGKISQFLTANGKPMDIAAMVQVLCRKHNKYCVADLFTKTVNEFFPPATITDCGEIEEYMNKKLNVIIKMEDQLSWGEETKTSIDISEVATQEGILKKSTSVKNVVYRLRLEKESLVAICQGNVQEELDEIFSKDVTINISNMMDEMWKSGESNLGCGEEIRNNLTTETKWKMQMMLSGILGEITKQKDYKHLFINLDPKSAAWEKSFNKWWDLQRAACGVSD